MKSIDIKTDPDIAVLDIDGEARCVVVDDFLADPAALVEFAAGHAGEFERQAIGYPGILLDIHPGLMSPMHRFLRTAMARQFSFFKGHIRLSTYLSMATLPPGQLAPLQRLCHSDPQSGQGRRNYAGLVYLFEDEALGGTGFYRWKEREKITQATALEADEPGSSLPFLQQHFELYRTDPQYMSGSNEIAELLLEVTPRFNRFVFYPGDVPHSAHIPHPELLTTDLSAGRLTLNCFADVRPK